jgi:deazaflavin-dependent oxidoreductase (nitroreductase family)
MSDWNEKIIEEFRANHGKVGGPFADSRLILLTTTGAKTGTRHTTPLSYLPDGERILVIASAAGTPRHPAWYHNLVANPLVTVEDGSFSYDAQATVLDCAERDRLFARAAEAEPEWAEYQARVGRTIPVIALEAVPGPPRPNAATWGEALRHVHDAYRRELALIRKEIAASGSALGAQLRVNCLSLCQGLGFHHASEDRGTFPALREQHPDLAPVLDRLSREHTRLAALLERFRRLLAAPQAGPVPVLAEADRIIEELEAHLAYEEEHLLPVLDIPVSSGG